MRFLLTHPSETRPSLVVDTCSAITDAAIAQMKADLHGLGRSSGLLFDERQCLILRDTYSSMDIGSIEVETRQPTDAVLARVARVPLDERVGRWLEMLSAGWDSALPLEPAVAAPFIADIVPAASGSMLHALEGAA
ncbi:MAG: hypothetical protein WCJ30_27445 [Deltaproteobacteria bacterium]